MTVLLGKLTLLEYIATRHLGRYGGMLPVFMPVCTTLLYCISLMTHHVCWNVDRSLRTHVCKQEHKSISIAAEPKKNALFLKFSTHMVLLHCLIFSGITVLNFGDLYSQ